MAMYYYASKLTAVACGLRCKQQQQHKHRRRKGSAPGASGSGTGDDDDEEVVVDYRGGEHNLDEILQKKWNNNNQQSVSGREEDRGEEVFIANRIRNQESLSCCKITLSLPHTLSMEIGWN